jgi:hypothetical protein
MERLRVSHLQIFNICEDDQSLLVFRCVREDFFCGATMYDEFMKASNERKLIERFKLG